MSSELVRSERPLRIVNFISGGGSTNLSILEAEREGHSLYGLSETVAIITSDPKAGGVQKSIEAGFPAGHVMSVKADRKDLPEQLLEILDFYKPDFFHQLDWLPKTPEEVATKYWGLNQHFGPGGRWMYGVRRADTHIRFCQAVGEVRPIPVFCQLVDPLKYDGGDTIHICWETPRDRETPEELADRLLPLEHQVQIEARKMLALASVNLQSVPGLARTKQEEELLNRIMKESRNKYPAHQ